MNVETGAEAALFPEKEYISGIFVAVWSSNLQDGAVDLCWILRHRCSILCNLLDLNFCCGDLYILWRKLNKNFLKRLVSRDLRPVNLLALHYITFVSSCIWPYFYLHSHYSDILNTLLKSVTYASFSF